MTQPYFTAADVKAHQKRHHGDVVCTCSARALASHSQSCPVSIFMRTAGPGETAAIIKPAKKSRRALKQHREPNQTEAEFGSRVLDPRCRRGEIYSYGYEDVTLRWADMEYTPDWHVCEPFDSRRLDPVISEIVPMIHVFIEIKGGHKWEDSIIKWKAFSKGKPFPWARFELWQKEGGQWRRLG